MLFRAPEVADEKAVPLVDEALGHGEEHVVTQATGVPFLKALLAQEGSPGLKEPENGRSAVLGEIVYGAKTLQRGADPQELEFLELWIADVSQRAQSSNTSLN